MKTGSILVGLVILTAVIALFWTPFDPVHAIAADRLQNPSWHHLLGTDRFGRDILSRLMSGARITIYVGVLSVLIAAVVGIPLGISAGLRRGVLESIIMRCTDIALAFPALLLAIIVGAVWGPSTTTAVIAIGLAGIPSFARVARAGTLQVASQDFIQSARISRVSTPVIAVRHILPNILGLIIVQATVYFALAILAEAGLSYLGLGTAAPAASWGRMLRDAQTMLALAPLQALWPGLAIAISVLGFNLLGDGLRDHFDPKTKDA